MWTAALVLAVFAAALLVSAAASAAQAAPKTKGLVRGVVVLGPLTTGDRGAQLSWPPVKAVVKIFRHGQTVPFRTLRTGDDGRFSVRLTSGTYRFTAELPGPSTMPIPHDVTTRVRAGRTRNIRLWLDTGLSFPDAKDVGHTVTPVEPPDGSHTYPQGVLGSTRRGPIVPVVRPEEPSDAPCDATLLFYRPDGRLVARVASTKQDGFIVSLPAATYVVSASSALSTFDRGGPFTLKVPRGRWLSLTVMFDTGIRFTDPGAAAR
jgi:hypothetical protein